MRPPRLVHLVTAGPPSSPRPAGPLAHLQQLNAHPQPFLARPHRSYEPSASASASTLPHQHQLFQPSKPTKRINANKTEHKTHVMPTVAFPAPV